MKAQALIIFAVIVGLAIFSTAPYLSSFSKSIFWDVKVKELIFENMFEETFASVEISLNNISSIPQNLFNFLDFIRVKTLKEVSKEVALLIISNKSSSKLKFTIINFLTYSSSFSIEFNQSLRSKILNDREVWEFQEDYTPGKNYTIYFSFGDNSFTLFLNSSNKDLVFSFIFLSLESRNSVQRKFEQRIYYLNI
ncbi:MAG: hypothetical protein J7L39_02795 [Candidatus Aenigmarchaeota archaeon]|nr:hypothetical protein [Candidatus Aenigmarchaeota archaeon]